MDKNLSKHERRLLKLQERKEIGKIMDEESKKNKQMDKIKKYGIIAIIIIGLVGGYLLLPKAEPVDLKVGNLVFPLGKIHWHAIPTVYICGENIPIPRPLSDVHLGGSLLHTHQDAKAHIEGSVSDPSQITLGLFMINIGMTFTDTALVDKKNGDSCLNGNPGTVKLFVNGIQNSDLSNYVLRDGDLIEMKFE